MTNELITKARSRKTAIKKEMDMIAEFMDTSNELIDEENLSNVSVDDIVKEYQDPLVAELGGHSVPYELLEPKSTTPKSKIKQFLFHAGVILIIIIMSLATVGGYLWYLNRDNLEPAKELLSSMSN